MVGSYTGKVHYNQKADKVTLVEFGGIQIQNSKINDVPIGNMSYVRRSNGITKGAVNTNVVIYSSGSISYGSDITYVNNSNSGDYFIVNKDGIYAVSVNATMSTTNRSLSINIGTLTNSFNSSNTMATMTDQNQVSISTSWIGPVFSGNLVYVLFDDSAPTSSHGPAANMITIARIS